MFLMWCGCFAQSRRLKESGNITQALPDFQIERKDSTIAGTSGSIDFTRNQHVEDFSSTESSAKHNKDKDSFIIGS
ncbi:hypothetical protein Tco_1078304, partial [Tanacetum coccineum]